MANQGLLPTDFVNKFDNKIKGILYEGLEFGQVLDIRCYHPTYVIIDEAVVKATRCSSTSGDFVSVERFLWSRLPALESEVLEILQGGDENAKFELKAQQYPSRYLKELGNYNDLFACHPEQRVKAYNLKLCVGSILSIGSVLKQKCPIITVWKRRLFFKAARLLSFKTHGVILNKLWMDFFGVEDFDKDLLVDSRLPSSIFTFSSIKDLKKGIQEFACFACDIDERKNYGTHKNLKQHWRDFHPNFDLYCSLCPDKKKPFASMDYYHRHMEKVHGVENPNNRVEEEGQEQQQQQQQQQEQEEQDFGFTLNQNRKKDYNNTSNLDQKDLIEPDLLLLPSTSLLASGTKRKIGNEGKGALPNKKPSYRGRYLSRPSYKDLLKENEQLWRAIEILQGEKTEELLRNEIPKKEPVQNNKDGFDDYDENLLFEMLGIQGDDNGANKANKANGANGANGNDGAETSHDDNPFEDLLKLL